MADEGTGARLMIEHAADGSFLGWCSVSRWNADYRSAALGYCLAEAAWGHGYATEAARALLQWAFEALDLNRVQAETDTRNRASARAGEARVHARGDPARGLRRERRRVRLLGVRPAQAGVATRLLRLPLTFNV
jgi:hypothetical protein